MVCRQVCPIPPPGHPGKPHLGRNFVSGEPLFRIFSQVGNDALQGVFLYTLGVNVGAFSSAVVDNKVDAFLIQCIQIIQGIYMGNIFIQCHSEAFEGKGLNQIVNNPQMQCFFQRLPFVGSCNHDYIHLDLAFADLPQSLKAVHLGHEYIQNQQVCLLLFQKRQGRFTVPAHTCHKKLLMPTDILLIDHRHHRIIFHNQYLVHITPPLLQSLRKKTSQCPAGSPQRFCHPATPPLSSPDTDRFLCLLLW